MALTRQDVMQRRHGRVGPPANDSVARSCSECGQPLVGCPARNTCSTACAKGRSDRRHRERDKTRSPRRKSASTVSAIVALERAEPVVTTPTERPDWERVAGILATIVKVGLTATISVDGIEVVIRRG